MRILHHASLFRATVLLASGAKANSVSDELVSELRGAMPLRRESRVGHLSRGWVFKVTVMTIFSSERYQEVVVHDLRTPLNVIQLALKMLDESPCTSDPDTAEDLSMIRSNAQELERMLIHVVDFSRLPQEPSELAIEPFDPRRMLDEVVEEIGSRGNAQIRVEADPNLTEVTLDPTRARMAWQKAILNAVAASMGTEIRIRLEGRGDRCITKICVEVPPRESVQTHEVDPVHFERLVGTAAERRGLDLTIASRVSTLFGGTTTLESNRGKGTHLVLDWPRVIEPSSVDQA